MIGLFITAEPTIFNIDSDGSSYSGGPPLSQAARILWPCAFAFVFVPVAIVYVLTEKEMKREEVKMNLRKLCGVTFKLPLKWSRNSECYKQIQMLLLFAGGITLFYDLDYYFSVCYPIFPFPYRFYTQLWNGKKVFSKKFT